uniref:Sugar transporter SWEET1 n=1 Tax=Panagrolaimus sp. ES5 TaxID=591445 RepID=A0AC34F9G1_9BILA
MFEAFTDGFTFLNILSILAFLTTVGLFLCGIPICKQIWKRQDTNEISGAPFIMGVLGGTCWLTYGWLKKDGTVMYVTTAQLWISIKIVALTITCASLLASVHFFGMTVFHPLGVVCLALNIADFGAPLAGLKVVLRRRATSTLPLPLCIANALVSTEWFVYGLLKNDFYLIMPNGIGSFLAISQLFLFVILPRKPGQTAPIVRIVRCFGGRASRVKDIEADAVVPVDENDTCKISKHRWSDRLVANVANVTGEIENVIHKVHLGDPFAYSGKLNKDDLSNDSITMTPESAGTPVENKAMIFPGAFPVTIQNEEQLLQLANQLAEKLVALKNPPSAVIIEEDTTEKVKRCKSVPDLTYLSYLKSGLFKNIFSALIKYINAIFKKIPPIPVEGQLIYQNNSTFFDQSFSWLIDKLLFKKALILKSLPSFSHSTIACMSYLSNVKKYI